MSDFMHIGGNLFQMKRKACRPGNSTGGWKFDHGPFELDSQLATVECKTCGEKLNPMTVLEAFANHESKLTHRYEELKLAIEKIKFKVESQNRVRCEHCEKLTRIRK